MFHESVTSCEPGPEYWYMMTGYFFEASKLRGFIIQPFSSTPSEVLKVKNSFCPSSGVTSSFSALLSTMVDITLPLAASRRVVTGGWVADE